MTTAILSRTFERQSDIPYLPQHKQVIGMRPDCVARFFIQVRAQKRAQVIVQTFHAALKTPPPNSASPLVADPIDATPQELKDESLVAIFPRLVSLAFLEKKDKDHIYDYNEKYKAYQLSLDENLSVAEKAASIRKWMSESGEYLQNVTHLDLQGLSITHVPLEINLLTHLESFIARGVPIEALPHDFSPPQLRVLDLQGSKVSFLPAAFKPKYLHFLYLQNTPLDALPERFDFPYLEWLDAENTKIRALPQIFHAPKLKWLYLQRTPLASFPEGLKLGNLIRLDIGNTQVTIFGGGLDAPNLKYLHLNDTPLTLLSEDLNLPLLESLLLKNTRIEKLPESLKIKNIVHLDIEHTKIPPDLKASYESSIKKIEVPNEPQVQGIEGLIARMLKYEQDRERKEDPKSLSQ